MKLLFIGAGNMGQAIMGGIRKNDNLSDFAITIYEVNEETCKKVKNQFNTDVLDKIDQSVSEYDIIVLAIKPQVFNTLGTDSGMQNLATHVTGNQIVISVMAGISIDRIKGFFKNDIPVVRVMPNTPAFVGESMSVLSSCPLVTEDKLQVAKKIFSSIGQIEVMAEKFIDPVCALSGAGPAYVYLMIEAMTQGGILTGLPKPIAEKLAVQTVKGSAMMVEKFDASVEDLRHQVTSPGGITIEAVSVLEQFGVRSAFIEAIRAAVDKLETM